ncbi:hypothetical protein B0T13DRAFT_538144 [Neurospora crassa]|nr:hypothetical protein B0T13DRAFT_538144 [Neurospora crassa]
MPFSWACRVPNKVRLLPWLSLLLPVLLGIAGLVGNVTIRSLAIGHPVSNWSSWADPQMLVSGIGTVCVAVLTSGFKGGAKTSFWVRARKGIPLSDVHYAWESTTSVAEAAKAIWRGKSLSVAWLIIICAVAITQYVPFIGDRIERQWLANKEWARLCYYAAMIAHIVGILLVVFMHWGFWKLDREYSMSPLELMNAVAHGSDESARSLLYILREAEENASALRLKGFAHEWDVEHEQLVVYTKGGDGH